MSNELVAISKVIKELTDSKQSVDEAIAIAEARLAVLNSIKAMEKSAAPKVKRKRRTPAEIKAEKDAAAANDAAPPKTDEGQA